MRLIDWIGGIALIVGGAVMYWSTYKDPAKKREARAGAIIVIIGSFLSVGRWIWHEFF